MIATSSVEAADPVPTSLTATPYLQNFDATFASGNDRLDYTTARLRPRSGRVSTPISYAGFLDQHHQWPLGIPRRHWVGEPNKRDGQLFSESFHIGGARCP